MCGEQGIAFVPFFAIAGERREAGADLSAQHDAVTAVAARHGATPAQVRLAWTLHRGPHVLAIPGTGNPDHLAENVAAGALRLTDEDLAARCERRLTRGAAATPVGCAARAAPARAAPAPPARARAPGR